MTQNVIRSITGRASYTTRLLYTRVRVVVEIPSQHVLTCPHLSQWSTQLESDPGPDHTMFTRLLLPLCCLCFAPTPSLGQESPLPPYMLGKFQLETSKGFDDFMYEINVNWFTRKVRLDSTEVSCPKWPDFLKTNIKSLFFKYLHL